MLHLDSVMKNLLKIAAAVTLALLISGTTEPCRAMDRNAFSSVQEIKKDIRQAKQVKVQFNNKRKGSPMQYHIENGDTVFFQNFQPIYVFHTEKKKGKNWREYYRTVWNFNKVYPYALKAKEILTEANRDIENGHMNAREKEKYLKNLEKKLFAEFEKPLRNLTFSQGRMLLRLIERECGLSSYYIISTYRGNMTAGFWQGVAKLFGSDLKKPYDRFGEDKVLEELVQMYNNGSFPYLYRSIFG